MSSAKRLSWRINAIALAFGLSCLGDALAVTGLLLAFHGEQAGGARIATLFAAMSLPAVAFSGIAGRIADRRSARHTLLLAGIALVAVCSALAYAPSFTAVIALIAVLTSLMAIVGPILMKTVIENAPRTLLSQAGARMTVAANFGLLAGPAFGGILTDAIGIRGILLLDAATYLALPVVALAIPGTSPESPRGRLSATDTAAEPGFKSGWRELTGHLLLGRLIRLGIVLALAMQAANVVEVFLVRDSYQADATTYGLVTMVQAASQMIGAWLAGKLLSARRIGSTSFLAGAAIGIAFLCTAATASLIGLFILLAVVGLANGAFGVARQTTLAEVVRPQLRGSALATHSALLNTAAPLALLLGAVASSITSPRAVFAACGGFVIFCLCADRAWHLSSRKSGTVSPGSDTGAQPDEHPAGTSH